MPSKNGSATKEKIGETTQTVKSEETKTRIFFSEPYHETLKRFDLLIKMLVTFTQIDRVSGASILRPIGTKRWLYYVVFLTILFESITALLRFYFGFESSVHTASTIGVVTFGIRIHHGYIGVLLLAFFVYYRRRQRSVAERLAILGLALVLSDLIHHFLVLWPITGDPQFHLVYPGTGAR